MDAIEILTAARKKVERPEDWGKGRRGFDRARDTCCAAEAIEDSATPMEREERGRAVRAFTNAAGIDAKTLIPTWNDARERTHAEVLAAFDLAIATLRL